MSRSLQVLERAIFGLMLIAVLYLVGDCLTMAHAEWQIRHENAEVSR